MCIRDRLEAMSDPQSNASATVGSTSSLTKASLSADAPTHSAQPREDLRPAAKNRTMQRTFWNLEANASEERDENATRTTVRKTDHETRETPKRESGGLGNANPWVETGQTDDFTRLLGIDSEISNVISNAGIDSFAKLTQASVSNLRSILDNAGPEFELVDPSTWPEQAIYASQGNWNLHERWRTSEVSEHNELADELELLEQTRMLLANTADCHVDVAEDEFINDEQARNMIRSILMLSLIHI